MMRTWTAALLFVLVPFARATAQGQSTAAGVRSDPDTTVGRVDLSGTVYDSVARKPLARAVVQVTPDASLGEHTHRPVYTATTDVGGRYHLTGIPPGGYLATFFHPALDALGLAPVTRRITLVAGKSARLDFAIPAPATVWALLCEPTDTADSTGLLIGRVYDIDGQAPVAGGQVTARWRELVFDTTTGIRTVRHELSVESDVSGRYTMCGLPTAGSVQLQAIHGRAASGLVAVAVPTRCVIQIALALSDANNRVVLQRDSAGLDSGTVLLRGTARLAGAVRSQTGQPMGDVELRVLGTGVTGQTAKDGTFLLTGLPAGTFTLQTRRIGLAPERVIVDLASGRTTRTAVTVHEAVVLSRVTVYGKEHANRPMERLAGFLHRKRVGWGHFLTHADIERRQPYNTSDLFQAMLGVRVTHGSVGNPFATSVRMRDGTGRWCQPNVFLDGSPIIRNLNTGTGGLPMPGDNSGSRSASAGSIDDWVSPDDVAAIEVYPELSLVPAQFRGTYCGSVVIWSRYAFPAMSTEP